MINVRKANNSDILQLEELFLVTRQKAFIWERPDKFKVEDYKKVTKGETVFVAEDNASKIVGFVSVWEHDTFPFIHHLFVIPEYQRSGVGELLIHSLLSWLPPPYRLKCITKNQIARSFYKKNGWVEIDQGISEDGDYLILELKKSKLSPFRFNFRPVDAGYRFLVHAWLVKPHVAEWFYGEGLQNTFTHLDEFLQGSSQSQYWLACDKAHPFAFFITSSISKPHDELSHWCVEEGDALTLDMLIGDTTYLGKGLSHILIQEFLLSQFPYASEILIDPEATNLRAVHVYQKVGFTIVGEFIPSHSLNQHYMMRLSMKNLKKP